jgi:16S rRNA G966 N2-methylase RsmD
MEIPDLFQALSLSSPVDSCLTRENAAAYRFSLEPYYLNGDSGLRLYCHDAMELLCHARSNMFDLIFADPPYFLSNDGITCHAGRMVSVNKGMWDRAETFEAVHELKLI